MKNIYESACKLLDTMSRFNHLIIPKVGTELKTPQALGTAISSLQQTLWGEQSQGTHWDGFVSSSTELLSEMNELLESWVVGENLTTST